MQKHNKNCSSKLQSKIGIKFQHKIAMKYWNEKLQCKIALQTCHAKLESKFAMQNCNEKNAMKNSDTKLQ
jgi:hypothetical protein